MQHPKLVAHKRKIDGKKVKQLRREGKMPANVYGKGIASRAVEVMYSDFSPVYNEVGETGIINLELDSQVLPVLVKNPQMHFDSKQPLHVDFYQVNLKEKIKTSVPVKVIGEPVPVTEHQGMLMQLLNEIEIEALPEAIPDFIEADATTLNEIGDILEVADIKAPEGIIILTPAEEHVAQITELIKEEKEPEPAAPAEGETIAPAESETANEGSIQPTVAEEK